jgi:hypothetical protein
MPIIVYKEILRLDVSMYNSLRMGAFDGNELGVDVQQMNKGAHDE